MMNFDKNIGNLDLKARGVLLTLLLLCDGNGQCSINQSAFARENGLSRQELRTILSRLQATNSITNSATNSGTNSTTNLTLDKSTLYKVFKTNKKPIQQPILQPNKQPIPKTENDIDFDAFLDYFNARVKGSLIPQIRVITETRKKHIKALALKYGKSVLARVVDVSVNTPFLRGENDKGWVATFDWIFNPSNFIKIMEGNYDEQRFNNSAKQSSGRGQRTGATLKGVAREILRDCAAGRN